MKKHILPYLALIAFRSVLAEQYCGPCSQVDCNPLPSNCKYGVTLDHCGCCKVCVQGNGERCTFVPNTNGVGFVCVWRPGRDTSERINEILASQLRHPIELNPYFRAFFKIPEALENHVKVLNDADMLREHTNIQNIFHGPQYQTTKQTDEEYYKKYPTCGLFDYLTTETSNDKIEKAKNGENRNNAQLLNTHSIASSASHDTQRLVSEVQEITKTNENQKSKDVMQRMEIEKEEEGEENFRAENPLKKKLKLSSAQHEVEPTRDDQIFSIDAEYPQNISNNRFDKSNGKHGDNMHHDEYNMHHDEYNVKKVEEALTASKENKIVALLEIGEQNENGSKRKKGISKLEVPSDSMTGIYDVEPSTSKDDPASQLLAGTISDFITLFLNRAMAMHFAHEDARGNLQIMESKADPVSKLRYIIKRKKQVSEQHQPDEKATDIRDEESSSKDSSRNLKTGGQSKDRIDNHYGILVRKIAHDNDNARLEGNTMNDDGEDLDNGIRLFQELDPHSSEYENRPGIQLGKYEDSDKRENELLEGDWGNNKVETFKAVSFVKKSPSRGSLKFKFQPWKRFDKNTLKSAPHKRQGYEEVEASEEASEGNQSNNQSREKRDTGTFRPGENRERPQVPIHPFKYGSFTVSKDGQLNINSADVGMPIMEEVMNDRFPGRLAPS